MLDAVEELMFFLSDFIGVAGGVVQVTGVVMLVMLAVLACRLLWRHDGLESILLCAL